MHLNCRAKSFHHLKPCEANREGQLQSYKLPTVSGDNQIVSKSDNKTNTIKPSDFLNIISYRSRHQYQCNLCRIKYFNRRTAQRHYNHFHVPVKCTLCKIIVKSKSLFWRHHRENHKKQTYKLVYQCSSCFESYKNPESLRRHERLVHSVDFKERETVPIKSYGCNQCEKMCERLSDLRRHQLDAHKDVGNCENNKDGKAVKFDEIETEVVLEPKECNKNQEQPQQVEEDEAKDSGSERGDFRQQFSKMMTELQRKIDERQSYTEQATDFFLHLGRYDPSQS